MEYSIRKQIETASDSNKGYILGGKLYVLHNVYFSCKYYYGNISIIITAYYLLILYIKSVAKIVFW